MEFSARSGKLSSLDTEGLLALAVESVQVEALDDGLNELTILTELHRRGTRDIFEQGKTWCGDRRWTMRCLGADILGMLGIDARLPFAAESEAPLTQLLGDADGDVICSAVTALGNLDIGDTAQIAELAAHPASSARQAVAWCLGLRETPAARDTLMELSSDAIADVRRSATAGLAGMVQIDCEEIRQALIARLDDPDAQTKAEAMMGLALRGDTRATAAIETAVEGEGGIEELVALAAACLDVRPASKSL